MTKPGFKKEFIPSQHRLYYFDLEKKQDMNMLNTVEELKKHYTPRQFEKAKLARKLLQTLAFPSIKYFKNIIQMNGIRNGPVTLEDIDISEKNLDRTFIV